MINTDKLERALARVDPNSPKNAVLITTGAMAPIHKMHTQMLEVAKQDLESKGFTVGPSIDVSITFARF